jgi:hypothetical protein
MIPVCLRVLYVKVSPTLKKFQLGPINSFLARMGQCFSSKKPVIPEHAQLAANVTPSHVSYNTETNGIAIQQNSSFQSPQHTQRSFHSTFNTSASSDNTHHKDPAEKTVIALFPYESRSDGDLSFS